ncbi:MAG TPA: sensor histidine kinase [Candidatus Saccharimonadales bacterium]|nr:sensor histidine kinase [Candidatus Saccharimonadales bacterium]
MAQDAVAPRAHGAEEVGWFRSAVTAIRNLDLVPKTPALGPVDYKNLGLVAYVGTTVAGAVIVAIISVLAIRVTVDYATLAIAGITIFLMSVFAVRLAPPANVSWVPTTLVHLGLAVTFGPAGAAVGALAEPFGVSVRSRNGWFRTSFNIANEFLANVASWGVFLWIHGPGVGRATGSDLAAGLAAGVVNFALNSGFVALVIRLSDPSAPMRRVLRARLAVLPYSIGYGFAAFAFVTMSYYAHTVGFMALLAPVILLHGFLVISTRRVQRYEEQRTKDQREKEALLHKAVEASEAERRRIARDLHDGVVQNLAGMAFALSAEASHLKTAPDVDNGQKDLLELLEASANETRGAMKDLRTLIIDLAPPALRREGLQAALLEVLSDIKRKGTNTELDLPPNLRLREDRAALIFRVAQEILRNVAAHAQAKNVKVELTTSEGSAVLTIQDDGKGFRKSDIDRRRAEGHLGTVAIVELAENAGGTLTIDSEPGRGTLVVLTLPIE